jgi:hypothetical protein
MQLKLSLWLTIVIGLLFSTAFAAFAQEPEGPQQPSIDLSKNATHSNIRIGYYPITGHYLYQGDYNLTYNAFQTGTTDIYGLIDVDVEALNRHGNFQPDRLDGTFEIGARVPIHNSPIGVFYRHESTHNIDLVGRQQPSWEQLGIRYQLIQPHYNASISLADYDHRANCFYNSDFDIQGTYFFTTHWRKQFSLFGDIHAVDENGGPRSGFTDFWIEPALGLSKTVDLFAGYGSTHDVDTANGHSSSSVIIGVKWKL